MTLRAYVAFRAQDNSILCVVSAPTGEAAGKLIRENIRYKGESFWLTGVDPVHPEVIFQDHAVSARRYGILYHYNVHPSATKTYNKQEDPLDPSTWRSEKYGSRS